MIPARLNIIGCGKVGKTLGYLWQQNGIFQIGGVVNRSLASSQAAVDFIQAGQAITQIQDLPPADVFLLGCSDHHLAACCAALAQSGVLRAGNCVLHCSGAVSSSILQPAKDQDALIASIHPIKSFADPAQAVHQFAGTFCGMEGDAEALHRLGPCFSALGATTFEIDAANKTLYHAASVIACNYLVALQEISLQTFAQAGVERELARQILEPIVHGTVNNLFRLGTANALTGPIARGDSAVVERQLSALQTWQPDFAEVYRLLGKTAVALSVQQGNATAADLTTLREVLT